MVYVDTYLLHKTHLPWQPKIRPILTSFNIDYFSVCAVLILTNNSILYTENFFGFIDFLRNFLIIFLYQKIRAQFLNLTLTIIKI
jgi:hypothetical protein